MRKLDLDDFEYGWRSIALDLRVEVGSLRERPDLTPRWWRPESERFHARKRATMRRRYECGHEVDTDIPATHPINEVVPLGCVGGCGQCDVPVHRAPDRYVWDLACLNPIDDIKAELQRLQREGARLAFGQNRDRPRFERPICALCREQVVEVATWRDRMRRVVHYTAWCHGREDVVSFTEYQIATADPGTLVVWGNVVN